MLDIQEQIEKRRRFRQGLRKSLASVSGGRRDEIDVLRTAFWFSEVKRYLNADTAYKVEHHIEPEAFGKTLEGDCYHRNKWSKYEIGFHVPSHALAAKVDQRFPGSARLLNHVLWDSLRTKYNAKVMAKDWLQQLAPDFQKIIYTRPGAFGSGQDYSRAKIGKRQLAKLERRAGIEALACLTILLRESYESDDSQLTMTIGESLYRVLLILFTTIIFEPIAPELFDIYRLHIFPLSEHGGEVFHFNDPWLFETTDLLRSLLLNLEDSNQIDLSWESSVCAMVKLFNGDYGWDVKFALDPPLEPANVRNSENEDVWKRAEQRRLIRKWGLNNIKSGRPERWPPSELW